MSKRTTEEKLMQLQKMGMKIGQVEKYKIMPTRVREFNNKLPGGWVFGKVNLVYGPKSSGKTTIFIESIGDAQKADPDHICLVIPSERGEDQSYYETLGLNLNQTLFMPPNEKSFYIMEESLAKLMDILSDDLISSVLVDSWDAFLGFKQIYTPDGAKKEITKETVGAKAAAGSRIWPQLKSLIADKKVMMGIICQARTKGIGTYITSEGFSGGRVLAA